MLPLETLFFLEEFTNKVLEAVEDHWGVTDVS